MPTGRSLPSKPTGKASPGTPAKLAGNVKTFAADVPTPSLIGIGVIIAIIYLVMQRIR